MLSLLRDSIRQLPIIPLFRQFVALNWLNGSMARWCEHTSQINRRFSLFLPTALAPPLNWMLSVVTCEFLDKQTL
jgi:hypothetical protein